MERLTADEFISKIENSSAWSLKENFNSLEPELMVFRKHGESRVYLGPDPSETPHQDCVVFQTRIELAADLNREYRVLITPPPSAWK